MIFQNNLIVLHKFQYIQSIPLIKVPLNLHLLLDHTNLDMSLLNLSKSLLHHFIKGVLLELRWVISCKEELFVDKETNVGTCFLEVDFERNVRWCERMLFSPIPVKIVCHR
jgi:hypothetical protein